MSTHANQDFSGTEKIKWYGEQFSSLNIWGPLALFTKRHGVPLLSHYMPLGTMTMTPQWRCFACILMGQFFYGHQYLSSAFSPFIHFQVVCPSVNFQQLPIKLQKYSDLRSKSLLPPKNWDHAPPVNLRRRHNNDGRVPFYQLPTVLFQLGSPLLQPNKDVKYAQWQLQTQKQWERQWHEKH